MQLVHDIDSIIRPLSQEKKLNCNINFHLPLPRIINSDSTRLKQILINIASNAVKFTEQGLIELDITYNSDLQLIEFAIKDSGIGMSEREVERVFKPFEQADTTTTRRFGGTGLGLCISKNLAQLLGGDVYVTSTPGQGSCFCVQIACNLPADKQQTVPMLTELSQLTPAKDLQLSFAENSFDANILVAEDNPDNQVLIKLLLQTWGLEPDIANNGAEAVEMALVNDYQLIIMDMQMPVMGGLEATQMLRHAAYDGPIIALTANVMKHDVNTYLQAGCDEALAKPIDKDALESVLVSYLNIEKDSQNKWDSLLNSDKFQQINDNYRLKLPGYLTDVTQLYNNGEWEQLRALAHSLKGSAGCFGFSNIHHAAATLEDNLRGRDHNRRDYLALSLIEAIKYTLQQEQSLTKK